MSLDHAILGFLALEPMSGYDLKRVFDQSVQHFWPATQSQIYRSLRQMADEGWVRMTVINQEDRPDRKEYSITEMGRAELRHWLAQPLNLPVIRNVWLMQLFFAYEISNQEMTALFEHYAEQLRHRIAEIREWGSDAIEASPPLSSYDRARQFWHMTLDYGIGRLEWELQWVESVLTTIRQMNEL